MQELMALGWWWLLIGYGIGAVLLLWQVSRVCRRIFLK